MRKWVLVIIVIVLGGAIFGTWLEQRKTKDIVNVLNSIPLIDSITVKNGKTKEEMLTLTNVDPFFSIW